MVESLGAKSWVRIILRSKYIVIYPTTWIFHGNTSECTAAIPKVTNKRLVQGLNSSRQKGETSAKLSESSEPRETALWKSSVIYQFMTRMPTFFMEGNLSSGPGKSHFGLRWDNIYSNEPGKVEWIIPEILEFLETSSVPASSASPKVSIPI